MHLGRARAAFCAGVDRVEEMIPRVRIGSQSSSSGYPGPFDGRFLLEPQQPLRPIRILIDADLCMGEQDWSKRGLLSGLLTHELVRLYRFAHDGPPVSVPRLESPMPGEWVKGWAVLGQAHPEFQAQDLYWADDGGQAHGAIAGNAPDAAACDEGAEAYGDLETEEAAQRRRDDATAAQVAEAIQADVFITDRPYLYALTWSLAPNVTFLSSDAALPFLSLYFRTQWQFLIWKGQTGRATVTRGLFYEIGTVASLPAVWRWSTACAQHDRFRGAGQLAYLSQAATKRVGRALELRDHVHRAMNRPQHNDVADDALLAFDSAILFLMGALDAVARVAHATLGLSGSAHSAGWQRKDWRKRVAKESPELATLVAPGSRGGAVVEILTAMRNTVHSAGLSSVGASTTRTERQRTLIDLTSGLSGDDLHDVLAAMDVLDGRDAWCIEALVPGRFYVDPGHLLEQVVVPTLGLLDGLMARTPVERLPGVALSEADCRPPEGRGAFDERHRESVLWQLGL